MAQPYKIEILPVEFLLASEQIDEAAMQRLMQKIVREGVWTQPIPVERNSGIVMDGNHRLQAALALGLRYVPCILLDYADTRVRVVDWQDGSPYDVQSIFTLIAAGQLLPFKSTRHSFAPQLPESSVPLRTLTAQENAATTSHERNSSGVAVFQGESLAA